MESLFWITTLLQAPLLVAWALLTLYLLFLTVSAITARLKEGKASPNTMQPSTPTTRFSILVPAHDEQKVIAACLRSLSSLDYPADLRRVIVIADNCTDSTAEIASSQGVLVYERRDMERRGKGYALDWAMRRLLDDDGGWSDALVVFDADTMVEKSFLGHLDEGIRAGSLALQGRYDVLNPFDNWRTALLYSALLLHNRVRPLARQALGWTTLLKGNGMCFARSTIERFGWNAFSLTEDIEYTTTLLNGGIKVEAVPRALLYAQAPQTSAQANSQRMRWEGDRFALARRDGLRMLLDAIRHRSFPRMDWAMDLLIPPMAILVGVPIVMITLNMLLGLLGPGNPAGVTWSLWMATLAASCIYIVGGLLISGADRRAYIYLLCTPLFLLWKVKIYIFMLLGRRQRGWVRTERTTMS